MQRLRRTGGAICATAVTAKDDMKLKKETPKSYDESSLVCENMRDERMHHRFYEPGAVVQIFDHCPAQIHIIEQSHLRLCAW